MDVIDFNNIFYRGADRCLKREWVKSCNENIERRIFDILRYQYSKIFSDCMGKILEYDVVGFSVYKGNSYMSIELAKELKKIKPSLKIIFGGPEITLKYLEHSSGIREYFGYDVDCFVVGEGEKGIEKYLSGVLSGEFLAFDEIQDPAELLMPDYEGFDLAKYAKNKSISFQISRGCIRKCLFCSEKHLIKRYRNISVERVLDFIKRYRAKGVENFIFHDSLVNGDLSYLEKLLDGIIDGLGSIKWEAQIAVRGDMEEDLFRKIKKSGCYHLFVGLETGSDKVLRSMNKGFDTRTALAFMKKLRVHDISFGVSLISGYPGEDMKDVLDTIGYIIENKKYIPKIEQINPFVEYDGIGSFPGYDQDEGIKRAKFLYDKFKSAGFKFTKAYVFNLVDAPIKDGMLSGVKR